MKKINFLCAALLLGAVSCTQQISTVDPADGQEIMVGISTASVDYEELPVSRATESANLLAVQVYEMDGQTAVPYAQGLFSDWSALSFKGFSGITYKVEATMVVAAEDELEVEGGVYGKPFQSELTEAFTYGASEMELDSSVATLSDGVDYEIPSIDRYYGMGSKEVSVDDAQIQTSMKRMSFGVKSKGIDGEITLQIENAPAVVLNSGDVEIFSMGDFEAAYTTENYTEAMNVEILRSDVSVYSESVSFLRNKLAVISVDGLTGSLGFDFETPFEDVKDIRVLTFEDEDYKGGENYVGGNDWSSLIDEKQNGGLLLYGETGYGADTPYQWTDENNTFLHSELFDAYGMGSYAYWGGGHAVSNYVDMDLAHGDFNYQLSVYYQHENGNGGHNGSKNFAMHFGYGDNSGYTSGVLPELQFADGKEHTIDHMYICPSTYFVNVATNGNGLSEAVSESEYVKIVVKGYDLEGAETGVAEFMLIQEGYCVEGWNKFDLSALGKISYATFNVCGTTENSAGFSVPAYFAYDDVTVIM